MPVYNAGQHGEHSFIASALIPGCTMAAAIPDGGMEPRRAVRLTIQLVEALAYAHKQGVLHRDIKPSNILLDAEDTLYLMDFGLAAWTEQSGSRLTKLGALVGTPSYVAEQRRRPEAGRPRSGPIRAGVVLYEMLTGRVPFEGPLAAVVHHAIHTPPPSLSQIRPGVNPQLEAICVKALAKKPEDRHASGQVLAEALQKWLQAQQPLPQTPGILPTPAPVTQHRR